MKKNDLKRLLVVSKNNQRTSPMYSKALIRGGSAHVVSFNVNLRMNTNIKGEGIISLPDLIKIGSFDDAWIENEVLYIKRGNDVMTMATCGNPDEWPQFPNPENTHTIMGKLMQSDTLNIKKLMHFASKDELIKPTLVGVFYSYDNKEWVASDGYTLSKKIAESEIAEDMIIPTIVASILSEKNYFIKKYNDLIYLYSVSESIVFQENMGKYPKYKAIIPTEFSKHIYVNRKQLLSYIKEAKSFVNSDTKVAVFDFNENNITFTAIDIVNNKKYKRNISGQVKFNGDPEHFIIGFNIKYLERCMMAIDTEDVFIFMNQPHMSSIINRDILIMPVMIDEETIQIIQNNSKRKDVLESESVQEQEPVQDVEPVVFHEESAIEAIFIYDYSEKAVAVFGDTKKFRNIFKKLHGRYNPYLKYNGENTPGWIFSKKYKEAILQLVKSAQA